MARREQLAKQWAQFPAADRACFVRLTRAPLPHVYQFVTISLAYSCLCRIAPLPPTFIPSSPAPHGVTLNDALLVLRREMSLVLIERDLLRTEVIERRAREDELRQAREFFHAYVEWVEQLSVMEAEARKEAEFWQEEAQRFSALAQNRTLWSRWRSHYVAASSAVWSHWARVRHLAADVLFALVAVTWKKAYLRSCIG
jgi:hypothetical protein